MKIITFCRMPLRQKTLFFVNWLLCGLARAAITLFGYKRIAPYYGHFCRMQTASTILSKQQLHQAILIKNAVALAARYTPWNSNCLTQAMVAKFWCQHHQIPYMFFIGFAKKSEKPVGREAHAWLTAGPIAITGGHNLDSHEVVLSYSNTNPQGLHNERH